MPKSCAFLTAEDLTGYVTDDTLAIEPLRELGWDVVAVPWRGGADWTAFDAVVVRSTWDYQHDVPAFMRTLERIDASRARLENPLELMRWNMHKGYLRELQEHGVPIARTRWGVDPDARALRRLFDVLGADEIVLKPTVGASAGDVLRLHASAAPLQFDDAVSLFAGREYFAQPFLSAVVAEGEYAVIFFDGEHSHTVLKTPKPGDFRVQEEHGGHIRAIVPEPALLESASLALRALPSPTLYARVDMVRDGAAFVLMELELIEPALYLRMDEGAPLRFAAAIDARHAG